MSRSSRRVAAVFALAAAGVLALVAGCPGEEEATKEPAAPATPPAPAAPAAPVQEALEGGPYPTLILAEAQFVKDANGKPKPGPALMTLWRKTPEGWKTVRVEDGDSNVFHKALPYEGGILTGAGEKAWLKKWTFADGKWTAEGLWNPSWGGRFNRIRDIEVGDVNGDGQADIVMATHDQGVVAVGSMKDGKLDVLEMDQKADTFVHEIEIGDVDGDGKNEFFATPTGRNKASGESQPGQVVMYRWDGKAYARTVLDDFTGSHAKEILAVDLDGKGKTTLFSVVEAETKLEGGKATVVHPVEIRQYTFGKGGKVSHEVVGTIEDRQTRFLVPGDFDGDGTKDLVAAAMKTGLWVLRRGADGKWTPENIEKASSGFEHAAWPADLDGDGKLELYVASDEQKELRSYVWNADTKAFDKAVLGTIPGDSITWNITSGSF